ncbi:MAG: relaxase/mobilization nuclease domain-containing protein [Lachnospiraceae bacterium]
MAITKIIKITRSAKDCIDYVINPEKTDDNLLVSYQGCSESNTALYFDLALRDNQRKNKDGKTIKAYHFIQSFSPEDEITPEQAHEIGMEMMERLFHGKYAFVCSTHIDKEHVHNHFVVCAAERSMTGRKLNDNLTLLRNLRSTNDQLCREHGLDVIEKERGKAKHYFEWLEDFQNPKKSEKAQLKALIDLKISTSKNYEDFIAQMQEAGVEITFGNSKQHGRVTKYRLPETNKKTSIHRGYNLGKGYSDAMIEKRIARRVNFLEQQEQRRLERAEKRKAERDAMTRAEKILDRSKLKIRSMQAISEAAPSSDNIGLAKWKNRQNAMRMQKIIDTLRNDFQIDYTQVKGKINDLSTQNSYYAAQIQKQQNSAQQMQYVIENCAAYARLKVYDRNLSSADDQDAYFRKHEAEILAYIEAKSNLERAGVILEKVGKKYIEFLQLRLDELEHSTEQLKQQQRKNAKEISKLQSYQKEIELYLGRSRKEL